MKDPFKEFIKFAVNIKVVDGKKQVTGRPIKWEQLTKSIYNGEKNFAVLTGNVNGILVIDLDNKTDKFEGKVWFESYFGKVEDMDTLVTKTTRNGYHIFFKYTDKIKTKKNVGDLHIDYISDKACVYQGENYNVISNNSIRSLSEQEISLFTKLDTKPKDDPPKTISSIYIYEQLKDIILTIDTVDDYDDWRNIGFSLIDFCKQDKLNFESGLDLFKIYSKRNIDKYDETHTVDQWNDWTKREMTDGPQISKATILKMLKDKDPNKFKDLTKKSRFSDDDILKELDVISYNSSVSIHDIRHLEVLTKTKACIKAIMEGKGLNPIHDCVSKQCKNASLFSECDRNGYKICCRNCDFEYPPGNIPVDRSLAPNVFNMLIINKDDNINNKDTSQVAKKMLSYKNLIYTVDSKWYLYNESSGIYESKIDLEVMNEMEAVVQTMSDDGYEEEWFNWINKVNYKENLLKELKIKCFKRVDLDDNDYILGFDTGVLDLRTGNFRKGELNEYTTMKCGVSYDENTDTSLALEIISGIYPDETEREYALCKFALCLEGYNREQMITFNYGFSASNGKSYIMERLRQVMGEYGGTFQVTLLTSKMKNAGEANSSLIDFNKKRFMYCSEPEAGSKLNTNYVKLLTGDKIKARGLYSENEKEISPTYKISVCCNTLPNFDVYDEGIARRIRLIEYKTRFCENPKKKHERLLKKYSKEQELEISCGLLKLLVDKYTSLRNNNFKYDEPDTFTSMRKLYLNDNKDVITDLLTEHFEKGDDKDYVKMTDIKAVLKQGGVKEKDVITIQKLVEGTFEGVEFKANSSINKKSVRNFFLSLKVK